MRHCAACLALGERFTSSDLLLRHVRTYINGENSRDWDSEYFGNLS